MPAELHLQWRGYFYSMETPTHEDVLKKAKELFPYDDTMNKNRQHKISSKRRRFIQGAFWVLNLISLKK